MTEKPECPSCGSSNVYYRLTKGFCCRRCGNQFTRRIAEKTEKAKGPLHGTIVDKKQEEG